MDQVNLGKLPRFVGMDGAGRGIEMRPEAFKGAMDVMMAAIHAAESFPQDLGGAIRHDDGAPT